MNGNPQLGACARDVTGNRRCLELLAELKRGGLMTRIPWGDWTPQVHAQFSSRVRAEVFTLLLLGKRLAWPVSRDLLHYMIRWLATRN